MQLSDGGKPPAGFSLGMYSSAVRFLSFVGFVLARFLATIAFFYVSYCIFVVYYTKSMI